MSTRRGADPSVPARPGGRRGAPALRLGGGDKRPAAPGMPDALGAGMADSSSLIRARARADLSRREELAPDPEPIAPGDVVQAWLEALDSGDTERVLELSAPEVKLVGPRGFESGREALRTWLERGGARFETERLSCESDQVVVEHRDGSNTPEKQSDARAATRFVVRRGQVQLVQCYDTLAEAFAHTETAENR